MISVCIPTYNGEKYISAQITSILSQLDLNDEIIISDDSSTDNTIEILNSFNDKRIIIFEGNKFKSPIFNLENAIKQATGDLIFLSDQDDIWLENKVSIMSKELTKADLIISDCFGIDDKEEMLFDSFYSVNNSKKGLINNFINNSYLGCCMAFNRNILDYVVPFPKKIAMHDIWIGLNANLIGTVKFIDDKLIYYRRHGSNFSDTSSKSHFNIIFKIKYRLIFAYYVLGRYLKKSSIQKLTKTNI